MLKSEVNLDTYTTKSGLLPDPGSAFFLRLAADSVRDLSAGRDSDEIFLVKAMIRCRLCLYKSVIWENTQLLTQLRVMIRRCHEKINGKVHYQNEMEGNA